VPTKSTDSSPLAAARSLTIRTWPEALNARQALARHLHLS